MKLGIKSLINSHIYAHLEGDALNMALLVPEAQRATRSGLSGGGGGVSLGSLQFSWEIGALPVEV